MNTNDISSRVSGPIVSTPESITNKAETAKTAEANLNKTTLFALKSADKIVENSSKSPVVSLAKFCLAFKTGVANLSTKVANSSFLKSVKDTFSQLRTGGANSSAIPKSVDKQSGLDKLDKRNNSETSIEENASDSASTIEAKPHGELKSEEVIHKYEVKFGEIVKKGENGELSRQEKITQLKETLLELQGDARMIDTKEEKVLTKLLDLFEKELSETPTQSGRDFQSPPLAQHLATDQEKLEGEKQKFQGDQLPLKNSLKIHENKKIELTQKLETLKNEKAAAESAIKTAIGDQDIKSFLKKYTFENTTRLQVEPLKNALYEKINVQENEIKEMLGEEIVTPF